MAGTVVKCKACGKLVAVRFPLHECTPQVMAQEDNDADLTPAQRIEKARVRVQRARKALAAAKLLWFQHKATHEDKVQAAEELSEALYQYERLRFPRRTARRVDPHTLMRMDTRL